MGTVDAAGKDGDGDDDDGDSVECNSASNSKEINAETATEVLKDGGGISSSRIFQRDNVPALSLDHGDLSVLANAGVTAYCASSLETTLIGQVSGQLQEASQANSASSSDRSNDIDKQYKDGMMKKHSREFRQDIMNCIFKPSTSAIDEEAGDVASDSDSKSYSPDSLDEESDVNTEIQEAHRPTGKKSEKKQNKRKIKDSSAVSKRIRDDAYDNDFEERIRTVRATEELDKIEGTFDDSYHELDSGLRIPNSCWKKLYKYQKTGVKWLNVLHEQCVGGILADEMGLGKTVQIVCFLHALSYTQAMSQGFSFRGLGPVLVVCPATLMYQWLKEFRRWFPLCRVAIFHSSGTSRALDPALVRKLSSPRRDGSVLITSYSTFTKKYKLLVSTDWHYVVLDEGHKIRNPNAQMTLAVKDVRTPHRLLLSGSPLQNNLKELWSLIDFIYPGRLGSLQSFTEKFAIPITQGGYANANSVQVRTAYKCACVLRDAICPYLLRRMKKDVEMAIQLPSKTEQVLFCEITSFQRKLYKDYLSSRECGRILAGKMDAFVGLITLRKLCNHPDLLTGGPNKHGDYNITIDEDMDFGAPCRSGKMMVLKALLKLWYEQCQRVLIFSQSRQMLTVLEKFVVKENYSYLRMDGATAIGNRQALVEKFNNDNSIFLFLLTTRVGGLGVNLTGANRVIIFDPDWNPSTDIQARERAWRIGQERPVTIYRLLTSGTIEEKIYQRQIFKQFLANRVLVDPKQKRFFKTNDLYELFTLGSEKTDKNSGTETGSIFSGMAEEMSRDNYFNKTEKERKKFIKERKKKVIDEGSDDDETREILDKVLPPERIEELKKIARRISRSLSKGVEKQAGNIDEAGGLKSSDKTLNDASLPNNDLMKSDRMEKKMKKSRKRLFDQQYEVPFLHKQTGYKQPKDDASEESKSKEQDDYVLGMLLKNSRVHSALRHDQIVAESTPDEQLIEDEANAVARRAADSIRRSRRLVKSNFEGPEQKKARFGTKTAGGFADFTLSQNKRKSCEEKLTFGGGSLLKPSAPEDSLLAAIRKRKENLLDDDNDNDIVQEREYPSLIATNAGTTRNRFDDLADDIRTFLALRDGKATTFEILDKFKDKVSVQDTTVFRSLLRRLCTFYAETRTWKLKDEFV